MQIEKLMLQQFLCSDYLIGHMFIGSQLADKGEDQGGIFTDSVPEGKSSHTQDSSEQYTQCPPSQVERM